MRLDTVAKRAAARWVPPNSETLTDPNGNGVAYLYPFADKFGLVAYRGTAARHSFHYSYRTRELATAKATEFFESLESHKKRVADYRREASKPHTLNPGDIIVNSWGYDQTNVDWYRVTKKTAHFVWLQPIAGHCVENGFMSGHSVPAKDGAGALVDIDKPEEMHKAGGTSGESVNFEFGSGSKWDGRPRYSSWYA